ncbi:HAD-IIB family hydrolase [Synechococcus sp. CS-1328]|uniref:HAD-IIB family hydrolase n=1 Tax=Synechococcus sp. CS-1328 TaxID=2847976 RepID=UPI00223B503C|nr:HAD-IIB family hydrolase [Synechococcus sp. CS-1328]
MRFHAIATDFDGTIAHNNDVDDATLAALERAKKSGRKLLLVTGRELPDLQLVFPRLDLFDLVVVENGAVLFNPQSKEVSILAEPPLPKFVAELRAHKVSPLSTGYVIVATHEPHHIEVLKIIHEYGLELQVIFNKGSVMVLPSGVNKATGLAAALAELALSPHNAVAIGDAENDHAFMRLCECSAAVANALPAVKETADLVLDKARGEGVVELVDRLIANDLFDLKTLSRHHILIGETDDINEYPLDPAGHGVLVAGTSGSGKSTITTSIMEGLADAGYQVLVIDPEGDYETLDFANHIGNPTQAPQQDAITDALKDPIRSIVVNLLGVPLDDRPTFFAELLPHILQEKARTGRPHWLVIDETHHLLPHGPSSVALAPLLPERGILFITVHPGDVEPMTMANVDTLLLIGGQPADTLKGFCKATGENEPVCPAVQGNKLPTGDAMVWRRGSPEAIVIHMKQPRTVRKRHSRKYAEGNLGPEGSFYFRGPNGKLNLKAPNLQVFLHLADGVDDETWEYHRKNGDFSKWVRAQIKDESLADELVQIEVDHVAKPNDTRAAVRVSIEALYTLPADIASG